MGSAIDKPLSASHFVRCHRAAPTGHAKRGTGILNNELNGGRMVWNRLCYVKNPDMGQARVAAQSAIGMDRGRRSAPANPPGRIVVGCEGRQTLRASCGNRPVRPVSRNALSRSNLRPTQNRRSRKYLILLTLQAWLISLDNFRNWLINNAA